MRLLNHKVLVEIKRTEGDYSPLITRPGSNHGFTNEGIVRARAWNVDEGVWENDAVLLDLPLTSIEENIFLWEGKDMLIVWDRDILCTIEAP